jgi:hypothetical protein
MARAREPLDGRLDEAMRILVQSQAILTKARTEFLSQMADFQRQHAETVRRLDALERHCMERFSRMEAILIEHSQILRALADAVREKIGVKPPSQPA